MCDHLSLHKKKTIIHKFESLIRDMYMKTQSIVIYTTERSVIEFLGARDVCQIVPK